MIKIVSFSVIRSPSESWITELTISRWWEQRKEKNPKKKSILQTTEQQQIQAKQMKRKEDRNKLEW